MTFWADPHNYVVVGNPPYITVKDKEGNAKTNKVIYISSYREYSLSAPFAERLFQLAVRKSGDERNAGFIGQITANSFMKREFGKKLIDKYFLQKSSAHPYHRHLRCLHSRSRHTYRNPRRPQPHWSNERANPRSTGPAGRAGPAKQSPKRPCLVGNCESNHAAGERICMDLDYGLRPCHIFHLSLDPLWRRRTRHGRSPREYVEGAGVLAR